ncbi:MAG: class I SAM-dependent methyltransferase [Deltaproteobacteria bacterium]|nr:class I SAM-dependent methyltransferase [Deltaproteobacteria bacterium]
MSGGGNGYYDELAAHPDPARVVGWESQALQALRHDAALAVARPGERVLDVGCGLGDLGARALERGLGLDYVGVDAIAAMVARGRARHPGLDLRALDALAAPLPACDVAVAVGALVSGESLRSDGARLGRFRRLTETMVAAATRAVVWVVLDQDALEARPALLADEALGGVRPAEVDWVAARIGWAVTQRALTELDRLVVFAGRPA